MYGIDRFAAKGGVDKKLSLPWPFLNPPLTPVNYPLIPLAFY